MKSFYPLLRCLALLVTIAFSPVAQAQIDEGADMENVVNWLRAVGVQTHVGNLIAQDLGLAKREIQTQALMFTDEDGTKRAAAIPRDASKHFVLFTLWKKSGERIVWRASDKGVLTATVRVDTRNIQRKVSNKRYADDFYWIKMFMYNKAQKK